MDRLLTAMISENKNTEHKKYLNNKSKINIIICIFITMSKNKIIKTSLVIGNNLFD